MKLTKTLFLILLVVCVKSIYSKNVDPNFVKDKSDTSVAIRDCNTDLRGLRDVWNKIKESILNSWEYIKDLTVNTQQRISQYIENVRVYAKSVRATLEEQLQKLRDRLNEIIEELYGVRELVGQCIDKQRPKIEEIMRGILKQMSDCIMEEIKKLIQIGGIGGKELAFNETQYLEDLQNKVQACENDLQNAEKCLNTVREDTFVIVKEMEDKNMKRSEEARSLADDVKNTIVTCSMNNLADASYFVAQEVMDIAKCVMENNENAEEQPGIEQKV